MIVGSIKEKITLEKRVSITPESAKNIIALGLSVCVEKNYAQHLGIQDDEYKNIGMQIKKMRGSMARFIIDNKIESIEPLKKFQVNNFKFGFFALFFLYFSTKYFL